MFFSKRAFNVLSSSSHCLDDNAFFVLTPFISGSFYRRVVLGDRFEISCRTEWPFHIHNPETTMSGMNTKRVGGA
jgi:hypothetical protein